MTISFDGALREANLQEKVNLFMQFQEKWLNEIESMSLDKYTSRGQKDTFCYDIEFGMQALGSFRGGSSFKLGIYNRDVEKEKSKNKNKIYSVDNQYAWLAIYGKTESEAFQSIKKHILDIKAAVLSNALEEIDSIPLGNAYKWKIAFHFQTPENPLIIPIFTRKALELHLDVLGIAYKKMSISQIHKSIKKYYNYNTLEQVFTISELIWNQYIGVYEHKEIVKFKKDEETKEIRGNATTTKQYVEYLRKTFLIKYSPKHHKLENSFYKFLKSKSATDIQQNENYIDFQFSYSSNKYMCELKPTSDTSDVKYAIRTALGQLFEYSHMNNMENYKKIIVFQTKPNANLEKYLNFLHKKYEINFLYEIREGEFTGNLLL